jgi:EmrB/QacA subfamily drug resistance transporter
MAIEQTRPSNVNPIAVLVVLALGTFMTLLDLTIVNVAIPSILDGLHASLDQILWVLNAYSLAFAVLLITSGRLGDIVGPRNLFVVGMGVFTVASALSGLAQDPTQLILARAAQGVGAAILAPQGMPILLSILPPKQRGSAFAIFGILAGVAVAAGPSLGGFLVTHFGWRFIFYVNLPVGALTILLAMLIIPDLRPGRRHRLDFVGVGLATSGLLAVVYGLIEGQRYDWGTVQGFVTIPLIMATGVALLLAFLVHQAMRQRGEPLLPFAVFRDRNFSLMTLVLAAMGFAIVGLYLPLTIYLQSVLGLSAQDAGLTIAIQPVAMMFVAGLAGALTQRLSPKYLLIPGLLLLAAGSAYIAWTAQVNTSRWAFTPGLIVSGIGMGFVWTPVFALATRDLRPQLAGVASGVLSTIQELGAVIASAAVGAVLQNRLAVALHDQAVQHSSQLPEAYRGRFVDGFSQAAKTGFEVGRGQTGGNLQLPANLPASAIHLIQQLAHDVFTNAFVAAMRPAMVLPIAVLVLAALSCFAVRARSLEQAKTPAAVERPAAIA